MKERVEVRAVSVPLRDGQVLAVPYWVVDGGIPGPCLLLTAAQHGNEVNGSEAIRRFVATAAERLVCGRVLAVPFANLPAIRERRPHIGMRPEQPYSGPRGNRVNMNIHWPGARRGSVPKRLAAALAHDLVVQATHVVDLHSWNRTWAPALLLRDRPDLRALAWSMGPRFVHIRPPTDRTLAGYACSRGLVGMSFEFSGQYSVAEDEVGDGVRMLANLAAAIGLLPGPPAPQYTPVFLDAVDVVSVTAPVAGLFVGAADLCPGQRLPAEAFLGHILTDRDLQTIEIRAPVAGCLKQFGVGRANCDVSMTGFHPYVVEGEVIAQILVARVAKGA